MSEPVKKQNQTKPEGYSPKKPEIVNLMDDAQNANQKEFTRHESFEYRFDVVEFPENIKVAGVPCHYGGLAEGEYIGEYETKYEPVMKNAEYAYEPYTYVDAWFSSLCENGERIYGCLVKSLDNLPEGIVGGEIGVKKFLVMTVRGNSWNDNGEGIGHLNSPWLNDNFRKLVPDEFKDALYPPNNGYHFLVEREGIETFTMSHIESVSANYKTVIEKKFYAPMK